MQVKCGNDLQLVCLIWPIVKIYRRLLIRLRLTPFSVSLQPHWKIGAGKGRIKANSSCDGRFISLRYLIFI